MNERRERNPEMAFHEKVVKAELELWPEMAQTTGYIDDKLVQQELGERGVVNRGYCYFKPSHHFEKRLLEEQHIHMLSHDPQARALIVGEGPGFLARLLTEKMGIRKKQIEVADIDPQMLPPGFIHHSFDLYKKWNLGDAAKYRLILLPESVLPISAVGDIVGQYYDYSEDDSQKDIVARLLFEDILKESYKYLESGGELRMDGHTLPWVITLDAYRKWKKIMEYRWTDGGSDELEQLLMKRRNDFDISIVDASPDLTTSTVVARKK